MKTREEKFARILSIANLLGGKEKIEFAYRSELIKDPAKTLGIIHKKLMENTHSWKEKEWMLFEILGDEIADLDLDEFTNDDLNEKFHLHLSKNNVAMSTIMSASEAEEKWGLKPGTVRSSCTRGKLKDHKDVRKSGNTWLVTDRAMQEIYGENK